MQDVFDRLKTALADRYAIQEEIGAGGMATVYLAEDLKHERQVAVKVLRPELAAALGPERFLREIKITAQLNHPHILPLLDSGDAEGFLYYVMPYVEGESLRDRINREKQLPVEDSVKIASEVADALSFAHSRDVIHRDIKPENILLEAGHAVVADFGIAKAVTAAGGEKLTETGMAVGTPSYMSPEQAAGTRDLDGRSDIYGLGCVLYEMLAGQAPFTGPTVQSIVHQHLTADVPSVTVIRQQVPPDVAEAVGRALAKTPADRFATAKEFAQVLTPPSGSVPGAVASPSKHPAAVAALLGGGSLAILGLVYLLMLQLGLPDWVFTSAIVLLLVWLPIVVATAFVEQSRATATLDVSDGWLSWRRTTHGGGVAFAGLGVATAAYMTLRALGIGPAGTLITQGVLEKRDPILFANVVNRTSDSTLGLTMEQALRIDLSQSQAVRLVEPDLVVQTLRRMELEPTTPLDETLARRVARREDVKAVLVGEIAPVGSGYVLSARVVSALDGATLVAEREEAADDGELIAAINGLSRKVRARIGESLREVRASPPLAQVTTGSLDALRLYTIGHRVFSKEGSERALPLFEEALALDSTFAMAWRKLGVIYGNLGLRTKIDEAKTRAYALRDRVGLRERYHIEVQYYWSLLGDLAKVITTYEQLLELYPDDPMALHNLGFAYLGDAAPDYDRAIELFLRGLQVSPSGNTLDDLSTTLMFSGRLDEAEATARQLAVEYPEYRGGKAFLELRLAEVSYNRGDFEAALAHFQSRSALLPNGLAKGRALMDTHWLLAMRGRLAEAASLYDEAQQLLAETNPSEYVARATWEGMFDVVVRDDQEGGLRRVEAALQRFPLDSLPVFERPYRALARFYALADSVERAKAYADRYINDPELRSSVSARNAQNRFYRWSLGVVALQDDGLDEGIREFVRAYQLRPRCIGPLTALGTALERANRLDSAIAVYQQHLASVGVNYECRYAPDAMGRAAILKRLGELYEARNDRDNAIEYYNRFIELWKDADPELQPQVEDVKRRLAALVGEAR